MSEKAAVLRLRWCVLQETRMPKTLSWSVCMLPATIQWSSDSFDAPVVGTEACYSCGPGILTLLLP